MIVTDSAIKYFKEELKNNGKDTVEVNICTACCSEGYSIHIEYVNSDEFVLIKGVKFSYDTLNSSIFDNLTIDVKGEMIYYE